MFKKFTKEIKRLWGQEQPKHCFIKTDDLLFIESIADRTHMYWRKDQWSKYIYIGNYVFDFYRDLSQDYLRCNVTNSKEWEPNTEVSIVLEIQGCYVFVKTATASDGTKRLILPQVILDKLSTMDEEFTKYRLDYIRKKEENDRKKEEELRQTSLQCFHLDNKE